MSKHPFSCEKMARFNKRAAGTERSPVMRLTNLLLQACEGEGLGVLKNGELNKRTVREMALVYLGLDQFNAQGRTRRLRGEADFSYLHFTRILAEVSGLLDSAEQRLVVSAAGREMVAADSPSDCYNLLFELAVEYLDWGVLGTWPAFHFIRHGFLFSLFLLARYGGKFRPESVYSDMFLQAVGPGRRDQSDCRAKGADKAFAQAYAWRTMHFMGELFGLAERRPVREDKRGLPLISDVALDYEVRKTDLLDELISFRVPSKEIRSQFSEPVIIPELLAEVRPGLKAPAPTPVAPKVAVEIPEDHVCQLKISLRGARPPIWRRVLVKPEMRLCHLAQLIQAVMGWREFPSYVLEEESDLLKALGYARRKSVRLPLGVGTSLAEVFTNGSWKLVFRDDREPCWTHDIVLEKTLPTAEAQTYPVCVKGKRACPPDEFSGIKAYQRCLVMVSEAELDGVEGIAESFLGRGFDPELFVLAEAQARLESVRWV